MSARTRSGRLRGLPSRKRAPPGYTQLTYAREVYGSSAKWQSTWYASTKCRSWQLVRAATVVCAGSAELGVARTPRRNHGQRCGGRSPGFASEFGVGSAPRAPRQPAEAEGGNGLGAGEWPGVGRAVRHSPRWPLSSPHARPDAGRTDQVGASSRWAPLLRTLLTAVETGRALSRPSAGLVRRARRSSVSWWWGSSQAS